MSDFKIRLICLLALAVTAPACVTTSSSREPPMTLDAEHIADDDTFREWFAYFYAHQRVDLVPEAVLYMETHGYLRNHPDIAAAFLARVFAQYPGELAGWLDRWREVSPDGWGVILASLHFAGKPGATSLLHANLARADRAEQRRIVDLEASGRSSSDLLDVGIDDPRQINLLWSAFSATGDRRYVEKVVDYLSLYSRDEDTLDAEIGQAALVTLATNSLLHPVVAEVCLDERKSHPNEGIRTLLTAMLTAVARQIQEEREDERIPAH
jgi:hypothetical protein